MIPSPEAARSVLTRLLEIVVYALVIFGAVLAFRRAFHSTARPALRFGLWLLLLLRLTLPFTADSAVHLIVLPTEAGTPVTAAAPTEANALPVRPETAAAARPRGTDSPEATAVPAAEDREQRAALRRLSLSQWLLLLWIVGAAASLLYRIRMWGLLAARIRVEAEPPDPEILAELRQLCAELRVRRPVGLRVMGDITSPALTVGLWPTVLLPSSLLGEERKQARRFALLHELTHLKRGDPLVMVWYGLLRCLWWFHPALWLMEKPFRLDMESACDARAVRGMSREEKLSYASLLLELSGEETCRTRTYGKTERRKDR